MSLNNETKIYCNVIVKVFELLAHHDIYFRIWEIYENFYPHSYDLNTTSTRINFE